MKLSEAILLGSTMLAAKAGGQYFSETKSGCALGMAAIANGCTFHRVVRVNENERRTLGAEGVWGQWVLRVVMRPCDCWVLRVPRKMRIKDIIAHLFDFHVMKKKNWTLEQLVTWVRIWEPKEIRWIANLPRDLQEQLKKAEWTVISRSRAPETCDEAISPDPRDEDRQAEPEWQRVRQAFEARHKARGSILGGNEPADGESPYGRALSLWAETRPGTEPTRLN